MKRNNVQAATAEDEHPKRHRLLIILMFALSVTIAGLWWFGLLGTGPELIAIWPGDPVTLVIKRIFTQSSSPLLEIILALLALFLSALVVLRMKFGMASVYKTAVASALGATACAWVACSPAPPPPTTPTKITPRVEFIDDGCCYDFNGAPSQPPEPQQQDPGQAPAAGAAGV
jgi:hypothetical protein